MPMDDYYYEQREVRIFVFSLLVSSTSFIIVFSSRFPRSLYLIIMLFMLLLVILFSTTTTPEIIIMHNFYKQTILIFIN